MSKGFYNVPTSEAQVRHIVIVVLRWLRTFLYRSHPETDGAWYCRVLQSRWWHYLTTFPSIGAVPDRMYSGRVVRSHLNARAGYRVVFDLNFLCRHFLIPSI